jgi:hypothetical protein
LTNGAGEAINPDDGADPVSFTPTDDYLLSEPTEYLDQEGELERPAGEWCERDQSSSDNKKKILFSWSRTSPSSGSGVVTQVYEAIGV